MAQQYLLPCTSCGEKVRVDARQAGETVKCACGATLTVPTLRGLRDLEPVREEVAAPARPTWSPLQGVLFSAGLGLVVLGTLMAVWNVLGYQSLKPYTEDRTADWDKYSNEMIDQMPLMETMDLWGELNKDPLGSEGLPPWVLMQEHAGHVWRTIVFWGVAVVVGLVSVVLAFVFKPRPAARPVARR